tara:strand:- start:24707 stop:25276 length:570 start_codon:yes stop_codon:yes gene_type:complete
MKKIITIIALCFSTLSFSDAYNYWSVGYQDVEEVDGAKAEISFGEADGWFGHGRVYSLSESASSGAAAAALDLDIYTFGAGKSWEGDGVDFSIEGGISYGYYQVAACYGSSCAADDGNETGYYAEAALRGGNEDGISWKVSGGQIDLDGSASFFTLDINFSINENWGATLGMISLDGDSGPNLSFRRDF